MAHDLLFTEPLVENNKIKGFSRSSEAGSGSRFLPAAGCTLAAAGRVQTAAMLRKTRNCPAKYPAGGHASSCSETGLLYLSAHSTLADDSHTLSS